MGAWEICKGIPQSPTPQGACCWEHFFCLLCSIWCYGDLAFILFYSPPRLRLFPFWPSLCHETRVAWQAVFVLRMSSISGSAVSAASFKQTGSTFVVGVKESSKSFVWPFWLVWLIVSWLLTFRRGKKDDNISQRVVIISCTNDSLRLIVLSA